MKIKGIKTPWFEEITLHEYLYIYGNCREDTALIISAVYEKDGFLKAKDVLFSLLKNSKPSLTYDVFHDLFIWDKYFKKLPQIKVISK